MEMNRTSPATINADQYDRPAGPRRSTIADDVKAYIESFVAFNNPNHSLVLSLWTLHTWVFDAFRITPYIYVSSIDPGAGKTTLMKVLQGIVKNPNMTGSTTAAALFRKLANDTPTVILDELDTIYSGAKNEDLRNVLNTGYDASGTTERFVNGESTVFPTYCAKLLGGLDNGQVPATVIDRCIRIRLRKLSGDQLDALNVIDYDFEECEDMIEEMAQAVSNWGTLDTMQAVKDTKVDKIEGLSARQWQLIRPLLRIAKFLGIEDEARNALLATLKGEKVMTPEAEALSAIRTWFDSNHTDRISTAIAADLTGYTPAMLSRIMSKLGVNARPMKIDSKTQRGYARPELEQAFARFLD